MGGLDPQHKIGVVGLPAGPTPREHLACASTAEMQHTALPARAAVWKFHGFLRKRAGVESIQPN